MCVFLSYVYIIYYFLIKGNYFFKNFWLFCY
nr:MAG TPA: hypothetical protein [Caudoviricetes sp.]